jgi:kinetochore protein Spc7/SPC105
MSSRNETLPATRPRSRKSIAHLPSAEHGGSMDKENMTADIGALVGSHKRATAGEKLNKKSRSKSIGPGGLDALKDGTGNRRQV